MLSKQRGLRAVAAPLRKLAIRREGDVLSLKVLCSISMRHSHPLNVGAAATRTLHRHVHPSVPSVLMVQVSVGSRPSISAESTPTLVNRP